MIRIAFLGSNRVGKTSIVKELVKETCRRQNRDATGSKHSIQTTYEGITYHMDIEDTSTSKEFMGFRKNAVLQSDLFAIVFSLDDKRSFSEMRRIRRRIVSTRGESTPILVVGNKKDLTKSRFLSHRTAKSFVEDCMNHAYLECSVPNGEASCVLDKLMTIVPKDRDQHQRSHSLNQDRAQNVAYLRQAKTF